MTVRRHPFGSHSARWLPALLIVPGVFCYLLIALGPSLATGVYAFTDATGIRGIPVDWVGFDNFRQFLLRGQASRDSLAALRRTLVFCAIVTLVQFSLGLLLAVLLNQRIRGRLIFRTLIFLPVILGVVVQGLMWKLFLLPRNGPMATMFGWFGSSSEFLGGPQAFTWVMVVQIWANVGITMVIFLAGMQAIPTDLYDAAAVDGAGSWRLFRHVTWPQLTHAVNTNFILNVIGSLQAWQLFLVLIGYRPGTQVLGYLVYAEGFGRTSGSVTTAFRQGYAAAASIVLFVVVLILGLAAQFGAARRERRYFGT